MPDKRWRLLIVSEDLARQIHLSPNLIRGVLAAGLLGLSALVSIGAGFVVEVEGDVRTEQLRRRYVLLNGEMARMRTQVDTLRSALVDVTTAEAELRALAGLPVPDGGTPAPGADLDALVHRAEQLSESLAETRVGLEKRYAQIEATPSILPTAGRLSSSFSNARFHPVLHRTRPHQGLDITAPPGTPIRAAAKGRVRFVGWTRGYGLTTEIDHGYGYVTRYAHASRVNVRRGQTVERGEKIGEVGATGLAEAPHLHYEVLVNGKPANPRRFIYEGDLSKN